MKKLTMFLLVISLAVGLWSASALDLSTMTKQATFDRVLYFDGASGLTGSLQIIKDIDGNELPFKVSTAGFQITSTNKLYFFDTGLYIYAIGDGILGAVADTEFQFDSGILDLNATTITLDATDIEITGALAQVGDITLTGSQTISVDLDVDGTSNLDIVDIDGTLDVSGVTEVGTSGDGYDVTFYSDDAGNYMKWDSSANSELVIKGVTANRSFHVDVGNAVFDELVTITGDLDVQYIEINNGFGLTAGAFAVASDDDIDINTTDTVGGIDIGTSTATVPINIGNAVSEITFGDNITVGGTSDFGDDIALAGNIILLDADEDSKISANSDDEIIITVNSIALEFSLATNAIAPASGDAIDIGISGTNEFRSGYFSDDLDCADDLIVGDDGSIGGALTVTGVTNTNGGIDTNGNIQRAGLVADDGVPQDLAPAGGGAGIILSTTTITQYTIDGANALSINNGSIEGQKKIVYVVKETAGQGTLAGANFAGTSVTLDAVGSGLTLVWDHANSFWYMAGDVCGGTYTP